MSVLAIHDASDIAAVVERARALLTDGDVIAARMLASGAYDQAKAAAGFAQRFNAATELVGKARRLQGEALLIETRAKMRIADDYDAAQEAGEIRKPGQRSNVADENISPPTVEEVGLSRQDVHEARKLRDAERKTPGIVARAIEARLAAGLEPSRANLRAAVGTDSATKAERGNNLYETPIEAMRVLLALESFGRQVWEPACGRGAILRPLEDAGYEVLATDLVDYGTANRHGECQEVSDFLASCRTDGGIRGEWKGALCFGPGDLADGAPDIVTNPPYGGTLNGFVAHALREHRPRKMALLLNLNFMCGFEDPERCFAMDENPPARILVFSRRLPMMHRDGWEGNEASSRMNTAWFIWERQPDGSYGCDTRVWRVDWKDFEHAAALAPASAPSAPAVADVGTTSTVDLRLAVTPAQLAEWRLLGSVNAGAMVKGPAVDEAIRGGLIWPGKRLQLTVGGKERLAALNSLIKAASDGDAVNVVDPTSVVDREVRAEISLGSAGSRSDAGSPPAGSGSDAIPAFSSNPSDADPSTPTTAEAGAAEADPDAAAPASNRRKRKAVVS